MNQVSILTDKLFSTEEKNELAMQLAQSVQLLSNILDEKKVVVSDYKKRADEVALEIKTLSEKITTGRETVSVVCTIETDLETNTKKWVSVDSGEIIRKEALPVGYQPELELPTTDTPTDEVDNVAIINEIIAANGGFEDE
jgi:hypothetical protein